MRKLMILVFVLLTGVVIGMCIEQRRRGPLCPVPMPCEYVAK